MRKRILPFVCGASLVALSGTAVANGSGQVITGSNTYFTPLTSSAVVTAPNSVEERDEPWVVPAGVTQVGLTNMKQIEEDPQQSVVRVANVGRIASMWDMVAYDDEGKYVFIPHETPVGAGVTRYDIANDKAEVLFAGDLQGAGDEENGISPDWSNDWGAFDPCTFTPNQTLLLGEEWSGEGRIMEVMNPFAPVDQIQVRELDSIANVSHEGIRFSKNGRTMFYVDEWRSGSIYKFVSKEKVNGKWDYTHGQTFVLKVNAFDGDASLNYNDPANEGKTRTGKARWVPLTDRDGVVRGDLTVDPFRNGPTNNPNENDDTRGGRPAADEVGATPFGRPEDMEIGTLANGNEVLYFAATSEKTIYSVELIDKRRAYVRVAASEDSTPKNLGHDATTGELNSPDNLAQDGFGNIYIIEDAPNGSDVGGDIWFLRDTDRDGVAESLDHFLSIRVDGSEATGMIFNPNKPTEFVVAVQHPDSTDLDNVAGGYGDALWRFDIGGLTEPPCANGYYPSEYNVETCTQLQDKLDNPDFHDDFDLWWNKRVREILIRIFEDIFGDLGFLGLLFR